jgi:hypothetical protein
MKKLLSIIVLIVSFSLTISLMPKSIAIPTATVVSRGKSWIMVVNSPPTAMTLATNHASRDITTGYFELGICSVSSCGATFHFRKCFLDTCNY